MEMQQFYYDNKIVKKFIYATLLWGIVGFSVGLLLAFMFLFPNVTEGISWLSFVRLRPLHTNGVAFGFTLSGIFATWYYVGQRVLKVSLKDIDAPDATKSCPKQIEFGVKVRDYVSKRLSDASSIKLSNIRKTNTKLIAQVIFDGKDLGNELVEMGYASEEYGFWKPYYCSALTAVQAGQQLFDKDPDMSIFWLERSLILDPNGSNNTLSTFLLSQQYENKGEEKISIDYLKRSASLGWVQAMEELGQQYLIGNRVNQDKNQGKKWLKKAHDKGSQIAETIFCNSLPVAKQNSCKL